MSQTATKKNKRRTGLKYHKNGYAKINGLEIVGLKRRPDGRYYSAEVPAKTFGKDPAVALLRFQQWDAQRKRETVTLASQRNKTVHVPANVHWQGAEDHWKPGHDSIVDILHKIPAAEFWAVVRERILDDPFQAAKKTGLPLDRLASLPKPKTEKKLPLSDIGALYASKKMSPNERSKSILAWQEFADAVSVKTIEEIDESRIEKYRIFLERRKLADKTLRNRLLKLGTILNYARPRCKDHATAIDSVKSDLYLLIAKPKEPEPDPRPIKPKHFRALLKVASVKWRAMLLLALNAALHPKELGEVLRDEIDLDDGTFVTKRTKTGIRRCCKLWDRTVSAIKAYQAEESHDSRYLFLNQDQAPYTAHSVIDNWKRLISKAKLPNTISFDSIRDGARTNMSGDGARIVMGHSIGIDDRYGLRMPNSTEVVEACRAIEASYFRGKK